MILIEYTTKDGFVDFEAYPEDVKNQFVLLEDPNTEFEKILGAYDSEIQAHKIYKKVSHDRKKVVRADVIYKTIMGLTIIYGYRNVQD